METQQFTYGTSGNFFERWMKYIDGNKSLLELTIPGTHDSGTYPAYDTSYLTKCQSMTLTEQLNAGIRFLDIRLKRGTYADKDHVLWVYHGPADMDISFSGSVLGDCQSFLNVHKTETIIMCVKNESDPDDDDEKHEFYEDLLVAINQRSGLFYTGTKIPRLSEVRGKIVLVRKFGLGKKSQIGIDLYDNWPRDDEKYFNNYGTPFFVQDAYSGWGGLVRDEPKDKFNKWILRALDAASGDQHRDTLFVNFTSGTGDINPKALAKGIDYGPILPQMNFIGINKMFLNHIKGEQHKRYGIIPMDFPEYPDDGDLIKKLVTLNPFVRQYRPDLNGKRICNKFTGMVYLVIDGILRYIPNPTIAIRVFGEKWGDSVKSELNLVTMLTSNPLPDDTRIVCFGDAPERYLCFTEPRAARTSIRHIPNMKVLGQYGLHGQVVKLPANTIASYHKGQPLPSPDAILERPDLNGKRVHEINTGRVYLVIDGVLRFVPGATTAGNIFGADWGVDEDINPGLIKNGTPLPENTRIIRFGHTPELYLSCKESGAEKTTIRHIPSMRVLGEYGLHGTIQTSNDTINHYKKEQPLPAPELNLFNPDSTWNVINEDLSYADN